MKMQVHREVPYWNDQRLDPCSFLTRMSLMTAPVLLGLCVVVLVTLSICEVYSTTIAASGNRYMRMQCTWVAIGTAVCFAGACLPLRRVVGWSRIWIILVSIPLLYLAVAQTAVSIQRSWISFFPGAAEIKGAVRWLKLGFVQLQPSEFGKIAIVIFLAAYYGRCSRKEIRSFVKGFLIPGTVASAVLGLMILGKDLSTTVISAAMVMSVMFIAGARKRYLLGAFLLLLSIGVVFVLNSPSRLSRITAFCDQDSSYQLQRSKMCLGVGGLTGTGYANGFMKSYLPEAHTDFIVAVIGEEFGWLGVIGVIVCYLSICGSIVLISYSCRRQSERLLCIGIALLIGFQAMINIGVVSGMCPTTGLTAPFLSYGGSSMVSMMFMVGLIFNVAVCNCYAMVAELEERSRIPDI